MTISMLPEYTLNLSLLSKAERDQLVISYRPEGMVLSHYDDVVWNLWPYVTLPNKSEYDKKISFVFRLPDGLLLTSPEHAELLESVRTFLYVRMSKKHPRSGLIASHATLIKDWGNLRGLLLWMVDKGYCHFADLSAKVCKAYVDDLKLKKRENGQKLKQGTIHFYLGILEDIYIFRQYLTDALPSHPWPRASAWSIAEMKKDNTLATTTELIPDRLAAKLAQGSLRYIEDGYGEQLLACQDAYMACQHDHSYSKNKEIGRYLKKLQLKNWGKVAKEIGHMYTACYVVIDMFSGLRDSEMSSLELGCYSEHEGWEGATFGWIKGTTYKLEKNPKPAEWMVPPVVGQAVMLAERLSAPRRAELEENIAVLEKELQLDYARSELRNKDKDKLRVLKSCRKLLFIGEKRKLGNISPRSNSSTNKRLKALAEHLDLRVEIDDLEQIMNKDLVTIGEVWPLAPHQFRKTFAMYVAKSNFGDLLYLREHFKHWSLDMTLAYARRGIKGMDSTLFDDIMFEQNEQQARRILRWLDPAEPITGGGAAPIKEYRQREEVKVAGDPLSLARMLGEGYYIRATGHSWCTAKKCKGLGIYSVLECKECENRVIDRTHVMAWRGIRQQQIELLEMDNLGDPMWQWSKNHLLYAEQILQELGEEVSPYLIPPMPSMRIK